MIAFHPVVAFYQFFAVLFAAAVPTSILSDEVYSAVDRYGIGGFFLFAAWVFYKRLEKLEKEKKEDRKKVDVERKSDHDKHIKALNDEIDRLRAKYGD